MPRNRLMTALTIGNGFEDLDASIPGLHSGGL
jgi:hypothetical protein